MSSSRDIRRLAFQLLYQLDARGGEEAAGADDLISALDEDDTDGHLAEMSAADRKRAFKLASAAYADRAAADAFMTEAAPTWPAHRQAAVDRAILRLGHHEMVSGHAPPKVAVNEAIELAKAFSTDKSPAFINGLLDKLLKSVLRDDTGTDGEARDADSGALGSGELSSTPVRSPVL